MSVLIFDEPETTTIKSNAGLPYLRPKFTFLKNNEQNKRQAILPLFAKLTPFGHRFGPQMPLRENNGAGRQHPSMLRCYRAF